MQQLNQKQELAVKTTEGYVRVIAGAGAGKTRIIINRYIYLVNEIGIANENILCITFTNNAANEMKKRISKEIKDIDVGYICTFHSLAARALREDIHCLGVAPNFTILDPEDQSQLFRKIYKKLNITNRDYHYADMREAIGKIKDDYPQYVKFLGKHNENFFVNPTTIEERFFNEYIEEQRKNALLDYFDLISTYEYILVNFEVKRKKWQNRFQYIMCDEFNDVDARQFNILATLSGYHKNLMIVGDPDQTIYSWRSSDIRYIIEFGNMFPNVKDIIVNENYRSYPSILNIANSVIIHNTNRLEKDLIPVRTSNKKVIFNSLRTASDEAEFIATTIEDLIKNDEEPESIAILYRNNNLSRAIEEKLIQKNIKYCVYSGIDFYSRKEIKDILSYMRFLLYEKDVDFERIINVPARGIGNKTVTFLKEFAEYNKCSLYQGLKHCLIVKTIKNPDAEKFIDLIEKLKQEYQKMTILDLTNRIIRETGYQETLSKQEAQDRIENLEEFKHSIFEYENSDFEEKTLSDYLDKISLYTNGDRNKKEKAVRLMTIHSAKGLEFKNVFICRINDGIIPSAKVSTPEGIEEERRLFYVAITRAEDNLYLTEIQKDYGSYTSKPSQFLREIEPSRFLLELDKKELEFLNEFSEDRLSSSISNSKSGVKSVNIKFNIGDKVNHFLFGIGVVKDVDVQNKTYSIKFENLETLREISTHIKLEKL